MASVRFDHADLDRFMAALFRAKGMSAADAATFSEVLTWANLRGVDSHGVMRVPSYIDHIDKGQLDPKARPKITPLLGATFRIDCHRCAGPVGMLQAAAHAIEIAKTMGVGIGLVSDIHHTGAVGRYPEWIAERGFAVVVMVAGPPFMAYHGSKSTTMATAPIAIGVPGPDGPMVLDMATSLVAAGRIRALAAAGQPIPEGAAIDKNGNPTLDGDKAATVLPLGGPKGSGLSLMFESLCGVMASTPIITAIAGLTPGPAPMQNAIMIVLNVENFRALGDYKRDIGLLQQVIKGLPRRDGFDELLLPGERGNREAAARRSNGIPLPDRLVADLATIAAAAGVAPLKPRS
jgi:ureidoglycolate dehydrogenase (NAD+)